ncbi:MAG: hypothetical protein JO092_04930 [Candidatus Eremiobacteraeota bacterium]|nr:hypothetical protein [Candidatus Eremiobacteraeota bacterium]
MLAWLVAAVTVRSLLLPPHATIDPFGSRALMSASSSGQFAATVTIRGFVQRVLLWQHGGYTLPDPRPAAVAGFDVNGALLVNAEVPERVFGQNVVPVDMRSCENFPQRSAGPALAGALSDGSLIATMQSPPIVDLDDASGQYAPVVLHLRSDQCLNMGNGVAFGTAGLYSVGYTAYMGSIPAPSNVTSERERFMAMRWHERTREPLGDGVALAVNAAGNAAGANVPPGKGAAFNAAPHARAWLTGAATPLELASNAPLSVAYAIDDRNRVAGMLEDGRGRHFAFVWQNGIMRRLDDVVHVPGWRFECAYAFAPDDGIAGIGVYRGRGAAFVVTGL